MAIKFSNLASTTLASGVSDTATSLSVTSASLFPTLGGSDYFYATIGTGSGSEIVKVTAISGTTFTVVRGQDGTTAISHSSGAEFSLRVTAAALNDLSTQADTESVSIAGDTMTGNLNLGDNVKAQFGASDDLQIYHDASHSYIVDAGTGNMYISTNGNGIVMQASLSETMFAALPNGSVRLYYDNSQKLATTSTGIDVTGSVTADGLSVDNITIDGNDISTTNSNGNLTITPNGTGNVNIHTDAVVVLADEGESASLFLAADQGDDNADFWAVTHNSSNTLTIGNQISGSIVDHITITPNATVTNSIAAFAGKITAAGSVTADGFQTDPSNTTTNLLARNSSNPALYIQNGGSGDLLKVQSGSMLAGQGDTHFRVANDGAATFSNTLEVNNYRYFDGDYNVTYYRKANHTLLGYQLHRDNGKSFYEWNSGGTHSHDFQFVSNNSSVLNLATNGNVNIPNGGLMVGATTAPSFTTGSGIEIKKNGAATLRLHDEGSGGKVFEISSNDNEGYVLAGYGSGMPMILKTSSTTALTLDTSQNATFSGSVTADGLTVDGDATISDTTPSLLLMESDTTDVNTRLLNNGGDFFLATINDAKSSVTNRLSLDHATGDISFYEDTGTTPKLFWDASAESLGIGATSLIAKMHVKGSGTSSSTNAIFAENSSSAGIFAIRDNGDAFILGNTGIGTSSPSAEVPLTAVYSSTSQFHFGGAQAGISNNTYYNGSAWVNRNASVGGSIFQMSTSGEFNFRRAGTGANPTVSYSMTLTSDGTLLVGKTSASYSTAGQEFRAGGATILGRSGAEPLTLNRLNSDGGILNFNKDNTTVGSIGASGGDLVIGTGDTGIHFHDGVDSLIPWNVSTVNYRDASIDLGTSTYRFKDLHLSGHIHMMGNSNQINGGTALYLDSDNTAFRLNNETEIMRFSGTNVGIGTSSPAAPLEVQSSVSGNYVARFQNTNASTPYGVWIKEPPSAASLYPSFTVTDSSGSATRLRVDSGTGNVGIGTDSPDEKLDITGGFLKFNGGDYGLKGSASLTYNAVSDHYFQSNGSTKATITSGGNLLVGKTSTSYAVEGIALRGDNSGVQSTVTDELCFIANRLNSDGTLLLLAKDTVGVGKIGTSGGQSYIHGAGTDVGLYWGSNNIYPYRSTGLNDATIDLGQSGKRFKDLHLSGTANVGNLSVADDIGHAGDSDTYLSWNDNNLTIYNGGTNNLYMDAGSSTFNDGGGDVDFRVESNNSTHMLFVDGGNNRIGIGKSDPARTLDVHGSVEISVNTASHETFVFTTQAANDAKLMMQNASSATAVQLSANGDTFFNGGNVGIGTSSPVTFGTNTHGLTINGTGHYQHLTLQNNGNSHFSIYTNGPSGTIINQESADPLYFNTSGTERMRIRHDGNVLIGKTADNNTTAGHRFHANGFASHAVTSDSMYLNRLSTDGAVLTLAKDGSTVGSLGAINGSMYLSSPYGGDSGLRLSTNIIHPCTVTGDPRDAAIDLGYSGGRWKDLYLSGTANTAHVNVGGGTVADPTVTIDSASGGDPTLVFDAGATNRSAVIRFKDQGAIAGFINYHHQYDRMDFGSGSSTGIGMSLTSGGDLLVGKTSASSGVAGHKFSPTGAQESTVDGGLVAYFNRLSSDGEIVRFDKANAQVGSIGTASGNLTISSSTSGKTGLYFGSGALFPMNSGSLDGADQVSFGSPNYQFKDLYLSGKCYASRVFTDKDGDWGMEMSGATTARIRFHTSAGGTGQIGSITVSTSSTSYNTSSDYRLKEDVQPMSGATDRLKELKPVNFAWKADGSRVDGFLAHEAQEVVPESVTGSKDAMQTEEYEVTPAVTDEEGNVTTEAVMGEREVPDYQGIDQSKLVPLLVATIQELEARITQLENN